MKKMLKILLAVTFLSGVAHAADPGAHDAAAPQPDGQTGKTDKAGTGKKRKPKTTTGPAQGESASKHPFRKKAKDINRPEPAAPPAGQAPVTQ